MTTPNNPNSEEELREILKTLAYDSMGRLATTKHEFILEAEVAIQRLIATEVQAARADEIRLALQVAGKRLVHGTVIDSSMLEGAEDGLIDPVMLEARLATLEPRAGEGETG